MIKHSSLFARQALLVAKRGYAASNLGRTRSNNSSSSRSSSSSSSRSSTEVISLPPTSFAMSGSGWLMPFYLGVSKALKSRGLMGDTAIYGGTSGGSIGALIACADYPPDDALELIVSLSQDQLLWKDMHAGLKQHLRPMVTEELLQKCQQRLHITTTQVWPSPQLHVTSTFSSAEHLLDVVAASCFIPLYSAKQLAVRVGAEKGDRQLFVDGGVLAFMPTVGEVTVSPFCDAGFPIKPINFRPIQIHLKNGDYSMAQLLYWGLNPPKPDIMRELSSKGSDAANRWMDQQRL
ncbi:acyl transferase/acyl hydrolase/lysophospholipase [Ochromonadaceae sp. CCMP2298]|nr:acyl transferase/acyl hydrolase/lysophospholipase [Ochromonadaceae sp. CCMP2298]|mmetsp:Transcript_8005/g.17495  ORF Transcript_8005/g.17495 Transcript_8005/m.17495 type:complete len:292 (+) Transcript_8005:76-951(+)